MAERKKRKIFEERRVFNDSWTDKYLFVAVGDKCVCLVCRESCAVVKEYNIRRHYDTKHSAKYAEVIGELRKHVVAKFKKKLSSEQQSLFKVNAQTVASTRASFRVAHIIAQSSHPFSDGDFVKRCMLAVCEVCPTKTATFSSVPLSRMTVQRRVDDIAKDI